MVFSKMSTKRERLIETARDLFYHQGFAKTSLKDIANRADVPLGNIYYYFKTKDDLGLAAAESLREEVASVHDDLDSQHNSGRQKLIAFLELYFDIIDDFVKYGCPVTQICQEADLNMHDSVGLAYSEIHRMNLNWIETQFMELVNQNKLQAREYALDYVIRIQGAGLLAKSFRDPDVITDQLKRLIAWVESL